jgi:aromatic-L-amino-acid/L-tryptophan decarboxylase
MSAENGGRERELELDGAAFRALLDTVLAHLEPLLDALPHAPASWPDAPAPAALPLPREAVPASQVVDELFKRLPAGINTAAPGFMGYIPGGGVPHAAAADLIGNVINRYVGISPPAPHLVALERDVIRWFAQIVGMPASAAGTFTSGGSAANLIAMAAAREDRFPSAGEVTDDVLRGTIYVSDQAHHSVLKGARIAGVHAARVRMVPSDDAFRMSIGALRDAIDADRAAGLIPFMLVASAGTTNTGAVDPLAALADVAAEEDLWFHIDAAYGGFFALTQRGRRALHGIERADTLVLDPHKTLFLPYGTGALLAREPARVSRAFTLSAEYLPQRGGDEPEPAELGFELTRPFRGLRVWLPLRLHGIDAFTRLLDEKLDLALLLERELRDSDGIEIVARPQLSTLAFAALPRGGESADETNARTAALLDVINRDRRVLVTATTIRGRLLIRPSIVSFRTHEPQVRHLIDAVRGAGP